MSVYNGQPYLGQAVESILQQTFGDFEFIIVDDGSRDGSAALLQQHAGRDARIRLLARTANLGHAHSLNEGLRAAQGEYIARQDADDVSRPERLARQVEFLDDHARVGLLGTRVELMDAAGKALERSFFSAALDNAALQEELLTHNCLCHGSVLVRRSLLDRVGQYEEALDPSEDYDLWLRIAEVADVANLPLALYQYRFHAQSLSERRHAQQRLTTALVQKRALDRRFGPRPPPERQAWVARSYLHAAVANQVAGQTEAAQRALTQALQLAPTILGRAEPLGSLLAGYTDNLSVEDSAQLIRRVYGDLLPKTRGLARMRDRRLSVIHMRAVFAAAAAGDDRQMGANLWYGVRYDPAWLLNRGVLSLAARAVLGRSSGRAPSGGRSAQQSVDDRDR